MTLSRWIRDYVFTPISFSLRGSRALGLFGLVFAMTLCGLWHGAAWTFVAWGAWHVLLLVLSQSALRGLFADERAPWWRAACAWLATFALVQAGWLLFRARDLAQAADFGTALLTLRGGLRPSVMRENGVLIIASAWAGLWLAQLLRGPLARSSSLWAERAYFGSVLRGVGYALALVLIVVFDREAQSFVYFQF
jgi:alginate O-acetyltransferase complex protein AlgI